MQSILIKTSGFLFFMLGFLNFAEAQGWRKTYYMGSVQSQNNASTFTKTQDGGFFIVGKIGVKTDQDGIVEWETDILGDGISVWTNQKVFQHSNGNFVVAADVGGGSSKLYCFSENGDSLWSQEIGARILWVQAANDGGILYGKNFNEVEITKTDSLGNIEWEENYESAEGLYSSGCSIPSGGYAFFSIATGAPFRLSKIDESGLVEWVVDWEFGTLGSINPIGVVYTEDDHIIVAASGSFDGPILTSKVDLQGNVVWTSYTTKRLNVKYSDLTPTYDGGAALVGYPSHIPPSAFDIIKLSPDYGVEVYRNPILDADFNDHLYNIVETEPNNFVVSGVLTDLSAPTIDSLVMIKVHPSSHVPTPSYHISGFVFQDTSENCAFENDENPLQEWVVIAEGQNTFYSTTDYTGFFDIGVYLGEYEVSVAHNQYWMPCEESYTVVSVPISTTAQIEIPVQVNEDCPLLAVDLSTPFLRLCFEGYYAVHYCNQGTLPAEDATVEVTLADELEYLGTTGMLLSQNGQVLTFDIGTVGVNECGSFRINFDFLGEECDTTLFGQTLCSEAHIFPDSICGNTWTGAHLEVEGVCENDSVNFTITNTGGDMPQAYEYIVIEDNIIMFEGDFQLNELESAEHSVEAMSGATYHLVAAQAANLPPLLGNPVSTATVEGCVGPANFGSSNQIPGDDGEPWLSVSCDEVIAAYDPNDKTPTPTGWTDDNIIEARTDLEYRIRFQNTGTDTAFKVVIVDFLSSYLDPNTIRPGASSHPYQFDLSGQGVATFTFNDIMLPDSTTNEPASNGFVNFKISQQPGNPPGTVIENTAEIYFDFNAPVLTNTVFHTIGEPWVDVVSGSVETFRPGLRVRVFPNPVNESATFELEGFAQDGTLSLFDLTGRRVLSQNFAAGRTTVEREGLASGIYFFRMENESGVLVTGKVVVR